MARLSLTETQDEIGKAIEEHRYDDAASLAKFILESFPKDVHAYRLLGEVLWESGKPEQAAEAFQQALLYDPEDFVAYAGLGLIAEQQGQLERAVSHLQHACEMAPNSEEVRNELIRLYRRQGIADSARLKMSRVALGRIYARSETPARAIDEFRAILDSSPNRLDVRLSLAEVLWRAGEMEEAKEQAEIVLKYYPDAVKAQLILAVIAKAEGRDQHADSLLTSAKAVDPLGEYAERLFGTDSPLPPTDPLLDVPDHLLGRRENEQVTENLDIELPDWLLDSADRSDKSQDEVAIKAEPVEESATEQERSPAPTTAAEPDDDSWLAELRQVTGSEREAQAESLVMEEAGAEKERGEDAEARLELAWQSYQEGEITQAIGTYTSLVQHEQSLEEVIQALTVIVAETEDVDALELLGDAYMRYGDYSAALEAYNRALLKLE